MTDRCLREREQPWAVESGPRQQDKRNKEHAKKTGRRAKRKGEKKKQSTPNTRADQSDLVNPCAAADIAITVKMPSA